MKTSLTINATRAGKKVAKSLGFVNPDAANSIVGGFAQMVNALSNDTFVNAEVVKKMDTTEEDSGGGSAPATGKPVPTLYVTDNEDDSGTITYSGDGQLSACVMHNDHAHTISGSTLQLESSYEKTRQGYILATETDNFAPAWALFSISNNQPE